MGLILTTYGEGIRIFSGEYEFGRWMFLPDSNKTWLLVLSLAAIGGATVFIGKKGLDKRRR